MRIIVKSKCEKYNCNFPANRFFYHTPAQYPNEYYFLVCSCDEHVQSYLITGHSNLKEISKDEAYCLEVLTS